jgi:hypothetical protein
MPKSKHRKNHKEKLQARKNRLDNEKKQAQKMQREFIMNLIKQEQEKGAFNNTSNINSDPIIDGPVFDGPVFDGPVLGIDSTPTLETTEDITNVVEVETVQAETIETKSEEN